MAESPEDRERSQPEPHFGPQDLDDALVVGAFSRIRRIAIVLGVLSATTVWARFGTAIGLGYVVGCVISYVNFAWLERVITAVASRVAQTGVPGSSRGIVLRFLLRYGFIAIACFVILIRFKSSVYGLLGGLFLSVAAILCEAAYEAAIVWRRGA